ncbi:probable carboxylesterase 12 [Mangifera indica]|uniref:probable carboxylesterase 12 n=1 Tax=Mangifera indica TaxID=29780 RepID=UPI001CF9C26F|nr:probable carboxylesterase 12 [Mangifera indica]
MASTQPEIAYDCSPMLIVYKDGKVNRLGGNDVVPPSFDSKTAVESKDVVYSPENGLSVRLYLPKNVNQSQKLPLLVYFHGGGFCIESPFSPMYHNYINSLVAEENIVVVSVQYRRAPEHPLPCAYDDSWSALKWVASHVNGSGPEDWLNSHADFEKVFFSGDSAGANIAHRMGIKHGMEKLEGVNVEGIVLCHPYFWGNEAVDNETNDAKSRKFIETLWRCAYPETTGFDHPWINPAEDPDLGKLECRRVLVFVAEKDLLCARGWYCHQKLKESGWRGDVEVFETKGEDHVFHLFNPDCGNAKVMLLKTAGFYNTN